MEIVPKMNVIAKMRSSFPDKFGIPRQSGLVKGLMSKIIFEPEYRNPDALRGIEGFSHLWIIWEFSENIREGWSPTVRPPRLGGNTRMGVFATRSPFRPNPLGLSVVKLERVITDSSDGPELIVSGGDLMDGTPIFDIKPYIPMIDSLPDASAGFAADTAKQGLEVIFPAGLLELLPDTIRDTVTELLAQDPRPHYHDDPERIYGLLFDNFEIKFKVSGKILNVVNVIRI